MLRTPSQDKFLNMWCLVLFGFSIVVWNGCGSANLVPSQSSVSTISNTTPASASSVSPVYLYVAGTAGGSGGIFGYRVDPVTAELQIVQPSPFPTSNMEPGLRISRNLVFDLEPTDDLALSGTIAVFKGEPDTGELTQLASTTLPAMGTAPGASVQTSVIGPEGNTLYTFSPFEVNAFHIQSDGSVVSFGTPVAINNSVNNQLNTFAITPNGELAFARVMIGCPSSLMSIVELRRDPESGALTPLGQVLLGGYDPVIFDPTGKYLITTSVPLGTSEAPPAINVFAIDYSTGALTQVSGSPFPSLAGLPQFDPAGKFLYGTDPGAGIIDVFAFDSTTGTLRQVQTVTASPYAWSLVVDQLFVFYVSNSSTQGATIDVFRRDPNTGFLDSTNSSVTLTGFSDAAVLGF